MGSSGGDIAWSPAQSSTNFKVDHIVHRMATSAEAKEGAEEWGYEVRSKLVSPC